MSLHHHPNHIYANFLIFGGGGTGSRIVQMLAQLVPTIPWVQRLSPNIYIFDDDIVEAKNVSRQLFTKNDIGKNKAMVLAERYSRAYDVSITAIPERVTNEATVIRAIKRAVMAEGYNEQDAINRMMRPTITFLAVDSMDSRRNILASLAQMYFPFNNVVIDPGNEDSFGQVNVFNMIGHAIHSPLLGYADQHMNWVNNIPDRHVAPISLNYIPFPVAHYLLGRDGAATGSCADLDQTLAVNVSAATQCVCVAQQLMHCNPLTVRRSYFNLNLDPIPSEKISFGFLKDVCNGRHPEHLSPRLYDELKITGIDYQEFVNRIMLHECAYEGLKDHIGIELNQSQVELMKNLIFQSCIDLTIFTPENLRKLEEEALRPPEETVVETQAAPEQVREETEAEEAEEEDEAAF